MMKIKRNIIYTRREWIRDRSRYIPNFSALGPRIEDAKIDKITISVSNAFILAFASDDERKRFKTQLGRTDVFRQHHAKHSNIFNVKTIRRREKWLFGGTLLVKNLPGFGIAIDLKLHLNPSAFINHLVNTSGIYKSRVNFLKYIRRARPSDLLEVDAHLPPEAYGLDGNDNIIPTKAFRELHSPTEILTVYLAKTLELIGQKVAESTLRRNFAIDKSQSTWGINYAEIYWECSAADAVGFVHGLRDLADSSFVNSKVTEYPIVNGSDAQFQTPRVQRNIARNSPSLTLYPGRKGLSYVVYAKDYERVRFEFRFGSKVRKFIDPKSRLDLDPEISGISGLIDPAIAYAHKRIKKLFAQIPDFSGRQRSDFQGLMEALAAIATSLAAGESMPDLIHVLSLLAGNGKIEAKDQSSLSAACKLLEKAGVLTDTSLTYGSDKFKHYVLHPDYRAAIKAIGKVAKSDLATS